MKTIQEVVESTIRKTPFIEEALNEKLINVSSLARIILPEVSEKFTSATFGNKS